MASEYDAHDAILHHIFKQTQGEAWFKPAEESMQAGVALRIENAPLRFRVFPYENLSLAPFEAAVRGLNPLVAVKIRSASVHAALALVGEKETGVFVDQAIRIQILNTISDLPLADKEQSAAFIRDDRVLICWSDHLDGIIPTCKELEEKLISLVWKFRPDVLKTGESPSPSILSGYDGLTVGASQHTIDPITGQPNEKYHSGNEKRGSEFFGWKAEGVTEEGKKTSAARPTRLFAPIYNGLGAALGLALTLEGLRKLMIEFWLDGGKLRFCLIVVFPFLFCVSLFFYNFVIMLVAQVIGPVAQFHQNSKYYSAIKPGPNPSVDNKLPHVTIQMPVYKESLTETIAPSCESIKKAMQTYARQGGTSTIMICDDGMQLLDAAAAAERKRYYADHGIGWIARPGHSSDPDGFKRAGRFKKASNMNYALKISLKMEEHLARFLNDERAVNNARMTSHLARASEREQGVMGGWEEDEEEEPLEDLALRAAMDEVYAESGNRFQPWGACGRALRVGEIILIVDSDTIVPEDCLRDAAREMAESPELGVIQHESDVMQVSHNYFENGIAHFTRRVNKAISFAAANGEVAAFVGHNAFLRWSAIQDVAFIDPADGERKIWSETNVSEDFDMALRLQLGGYIVRWASYSEGGFKEGVSLTCDDELNRWEKYSFGCSELIFNPLVQWFTKGPINGQLRTFVWSAAPVHYKISMMAYMFSYYGIAASFSLSLVNYFLLGWEAPIDNMYLPSFEIWLSVVLVFPLAGNLGHTLLEYRLGQKGLWAAFFENIAWLPFFFVFFGGLSIHLSKAILAHLFSYNITWGATKKEVERSNFFLEVPKILSRFRVAFIFCLIALAAVIALALPMFPYDWRITIDNWSVTVPLGVSIVSHILYPIVLNPYLMVFSY